MNPVRYWRNNSTGLVSEETSRARSTMDKSRVLVELRSTKTGRLVGVFSEQVLMKRFSECEAPVKFMRVPEDEFKAVVAQLIESNAFCMLPYSGGREREKLRAERRLHEWAGFKYQPGYGTEDSMKIALHSKSKEVLLSDKEMGELE